MIASSVNAKWMIVANEFADLSPIPACSRTNLPSSLNLARTFRRDRRLPLAAFGRIRKVYFFAASAGGVRFVGGDSG